MLWMIAAILIVMWLLGLVTGTHALLVVVLVIVLVGIDASEREACSRRSRICNDCRKLSP